MTAHLVSIYVLRDPRDGRARYVGQAVDPQRRLRTHVRQRFYSDAIPTKKPFNLWLQELVRGRLVPDMEVLEEVQGDEAMRRENLWILWYRELGAELFNKNLIGVSFKEYSEGEAAGMGTQARTTGGDDVGPPSEALSSREPPSSRRPSSRRPPSLFRVYVLRDPRDKAVRYVGCTRQKIERRLQGHVSDAMGKKQEARNAAKNGWVRDLVHVGLVPEIEILEEVSSDVAESHETAWILLYRRRGAKLYNRKPPVRETGDASFILATLGPDVGQLLHVGQSSTVD